MFSKFFKRFKREDIKQDKTTGSPDSLDREELIGNISEFESKTAGEVAIHRLDVTGIPEDANREEVLRIVLEGRFSRFPVYVENIDDIVALVHSKDVFRETISADGSLNMNFSLKNIYRKPYFVPITKKIDALFEEMRKRKIHMVIVVDEYGGTAGIVTLEDLIEEIMGDIFDEHDAEEKPPIAEVEPDVFVVDGSLPPDEFAKFFKIDMNSDEYDYDTVGGFVIGLLGRVPDAGETPSAEYESLNLKVREISNNRIMSLIVTKNTEGSIT